VKLAIVRALLGDVVVKNEHPTVTLRDIQVLRLDVTMTDSLRMQVLKTSQHLLEHVFCHFLRVQVVRLLGQVIQELLAFNVLHHHVDLAFTLVVKMLNVARDVWVLAKLFEHLGLL
jgi:hypothetical protein